MTRPILICTAAALALLTAARAGDTVRAARPAQHTLTGDLTLDRAVAVALQQNPDVLKQLAEIERTRGLLVQARAQALPHLSLAATYDQQDSRLVEQQQGRGGKVPQIFIPTGPSPGPGQPAPTVDIGALFGSSSGNTFQSPDKTWSIRFEVKQVIYSGGQVSAAIRAQKFTEERAYYQLRDVIDATIASVRAQFYTVLTARSLITVAEESVHLQEELLKDQRLRYDNGTVPRFNVLRAEVELANVIPNLIRAKNDYLLAQLSLAKLLGLEAASSGQPQFHCVGDLSVSERPFDIGQALDLAKARRPFLKAQRQVIKIQAEQIKIAFAGYLPQLNGQAGYLVRNSRLTDDIDASVDGWFFGVAGNWKLFDGLETFGQVKEAKAALQIAKISYDDSVQNVELEVQQAYANLLTARETIKSQQKNVEQAKEALRLSNERLIAGAGAQLEVLDARVALTRAQTTELVARGDYNKAIAEFDRATATDTTYAETFRDPLKKLEVEILTPPRPKFRARASVR